MTELVLIAIAALLVFGLDRNHHRNQNRVPGPRLAGHSDVEDRDLARVIEEARAVDVQVVDLRSTARTAARVRLAIGSR
jgi:hypothetical protein